MTSAEQHKPHRKHAKLPRPSLGSFGRNELAIVGMDSTDVRAWALPLAAHLSGTWNIAYADAGHEGSVQAVAADRPSLQLTDMAAYRRLESTAKADTLFDPVLFNEQDLVLVDGNHFSAASQILLLDPARPPEKYLDQLTDVRLVVLHEPGAAIPSYLYDHVPALDTIPKLLFSEKDRLIPFLERFIRDRIPSLNGLILAGGKSTRMGTDKSRLAYHGQEQQAHLYELLTPYCQKVFISCNQQQAAAMDGRMPYLEDRFLGMGPLGGMLTAMQSAPDAAWLVVACDLPYLSGQSVQYIIAKRNPAKVATAFLDAAAQLPEPMFAVWEPKSYRLLLQLVGLGYSCPRKALMHTDTALVQAPAPEELHNVNDRESYLEVVKELQGRHQAIKPAGGTDFTWCLQG